MRRARLAFTLGTLLPFLAILDFVSRILAAAPVRAPHEASRPTACGPRSRPMAHGTAIRPTLRPETGVGPDPTDDPTPLLLPRRA